jgi:hypothetical protein
MGQREARFLVDFEHRQVGGALPFSRSNGDPDAFNIKMESQKESTYSRPRFSHGHIVDH